MGTLREPLAALDLHASLPPIGLVFAPSPPTRRRLRLTVAGRSPAPFPLSGHGRWTRFANPSQLRYAFPRRPLSRRGGKMVHDARGPVLRGCPCPESRRVTTSEARMAKRSRHRVSAGRDGRSERPATGRGQPRPTQDVHVHVHSRRHRATDSPTTVHATVAREGLPMPREPACDDKRSQDGRSERPATGRWQPRTTQEFQCHGIRERPATGRGQPRPTQDVHSRPLRRSSPAS